MQITNVNVYGLERAIVTSRYPKVADVEKYLNDMNGKSYAQAEKCAFNLADTKGGEGHDQFLTGIIVTFDMKCSIQLWQEAERYKFLYFISSTSKMHKLSEMNIRECCNEYVSETLITNAELHKFNYLVAKEKYSVGEISKEELDEKFYAMVYNIPQGFEYLAGMTTNYRELRNIYRQRKNHRLKEWQVFCEWVETLPMADKLITVGL